MSVVSNTDYGAIRRAIGTVVSQNLGAGIDGTNTIFIPSNFDRPPRPYATISIRRRGEEVGLDARIYEHTPEDPGNTPESQATIHSGERILRVQVAVYDKIQTVDVGGEISESLDALTPADRLDTLKAIMERTEAREAMAAIEPDLQFRDASDVEDLSDVVSDEFEMYAILEMQFAYTVETVEADSEFVDQVIAPSLTDGTLTVET